MSDGTVVAISFKDIEPDEAVRERAEKRCRALAEEFPEPTHIEVTLAGGAHRLQRPRPRDGQDGAGGLGERFRARAGRGPRPRQARQGAAPCPRQAHLRPPPRGDAREPEAPRAQRPSARRLRSADDEVELEGEHEVALEAHAPAQEGLGRRERAAVQLAPGRDVEAHAQVGALRGAGASFDQTLRGGRGGSCRRPPLRARTRARRSVAPRRARRSASPPTTPGIHSVKKSCGAMSGGGIGRTGMAAGG